MIYFEHNQADINPRGPSRQDFIKAYKSVKALASKNVSKYQTKCYKTRQIYFIGSRLVIIWKCLISDLRLTLGIPRFGEVGFF